MTKCLCIMVAVIGTWYGQPSALSENSVSDRLRFTGASQNEALRFLPQRLDQIGSDFAFPGVAKRPGSISLRSEHAGFDLSRQESAAFSMSDVRRYEQWPNWKPAIAPDTIGAETFGSTSVDVAAMVREEMEKARTKGMEDTIRSLLSGFDSLETVPLGIAAAVSFLGTALLIIWTTRRARTGRKQSPAVQPAVIAEAPATSTADAILAQARLMIDEKRMKSSEKRTVRQEELEPGPDRATDREESETRLMRDVQRISLQYELERRLRTIQNEKRDSFAIAKKLGVGRGELDLVDSLRKINGKQENKESKK